MKKTILWLVVVLILGLGSGYYLGYDHGFKRAASVPAIQNTKDIGNIENKLLGKWQGIDDSKFTRELKSHGIAIDRYEGMESGDIASKWAIFTSKNKPENIQFPLKENAYYMSIEAPQSELLTFEITEVKDTYLELTYLNRGGILRFTRIN